MNLHVISPAVLAVLFGAAPALALPTAAVMAGVGRLLLADGGGPDADRFRTSNLRGLALGVAPGLLLGIALRAWVPRDLLDAAVGRALGAVLIVAGASITLRNLLRRTAPRRVERPLAATLALGLGLGTVLATATAGPPALLLGLLVLLHPVAARGQPARGLLLGPLVVALAVLAHLTHEPLDLARSASIVAGSLAGILLGTWLVSALPSRAMQAGFACVLLGAGTQLGAGAGNSSAQRLPPPAAEARPPGAVPG